MKILDRYLASSITVSILLVLLVLLSLFSFITFANELGRVGKGQYDAWDALQYTLATLPGLAYQLFPATGLIGALMGLGILASHSELTAMRAAGVSLAAIVRSILKIGLLLMLVVFALGEFVAPAAEHYAQTQRSLAMSKNVSLQTPTGLWVREGDSFINIREIHSGGKLGQLNIFELNDNNQVSRITRATSALYQQEEGWRLDNIEISTLSDQGVEIERRDQVMRDSLLSPELLDVVFIKPASMSLWALYRYIDFLKENELESGKYRQAFWMKLISPLSIVIMVVLAVPFVFGPLRSMTAGHRVLVGTLVGIGFYLFNQVFNYVGLVYGLNPLFSAVLPSLVFLFVALHMLRKVH